MRSHLKKVPLQVWIVGSASLLITASAAMFFSVFALFLKSLHVKSANISLIDGIIEGLGYLFKIFSGVLSDFLQKRKLIFAIGAFFTAFSKLLPILFFTAQSAILGRILDRLGNGLQATPRDALISDYAPPNLRGTCFGVRQSLGTLGSVLGTLFVFTILKFVKDDFYTIFAVASVPAVVAFLLIHFFVRDARRSQEEGQPQVKIKTEKVPFHLSDVRRLNRSYWKTMLIVGLFMLCRFSESLMMLYGKETFSLSNSAATQIMIVYNLAAVFSAYTTGRLESFFASSTLLMSGVFITMGANFVMALAGSFSLFMVGAALWGIQIGLMQNVFCAEISKFVQPELRGTGFGIFYFMTAMSVLIANNIGGQLAEKSGVLAFYYSAFLSFLTCLFLLFSRRGKRV
ncbi:MFS transporter [Alphaproteobacteria bacterium]|nr:MFS transporter [Alphaproteobacteria bacterium]GHS99779.1 MFS transporter [Alphaproteobacteria bacterium]